MRRLLFNLHLYAALIVGLFLLVVAATGSIIAFEADLNRLLNLRSYVVHHAVQPGEGEFSVSGILAAAASKFPGQKIGIVRLPERPEDPAMFILRGQRQVFMDPYSYQILGERTLAGPLNQIHKLHISLLMGPSGKTVVTTVAATVVFLALSGIYLWWPQRRAKIKWKGSGFRVHFDIHNTVGVYSAVFVFILALTGIMIQFDDEIASFLNKAAGSKTTSRSVPSVLQKGRPPITPDQALHTALDALPGTRALFVALPKGPKDSYLIYLHFPEDGIEGGRSWVNVDQYSGQIVGMQNTRSAPPGTRAIVIGLATHTAVLYGYPTKILFSLSSLALVVQIITGYYMWWKKLKRVAALQPSPSINAPAV